jgi:hypothetical protein
MMRVPADEQGIAAPVSREKLAFMKLLSVTRFKFIFGHVPTNASENTTCRVHVRRIEALHRELESKSVIHPNALLQSKPWGSREFGIVDNDG